MPECADFVVASQLGSGSRHMPCGQAGEWVCRAIEECFQAAKNECGPDQYEVRRYVG